MSTKKLTGIHKGNSSKRKVGSLRCNPSAMNLYRCGRCRGPVSSAEAMVDGTAMSHPRCVRRSNAA